MLLIVFAGILLLLLHVAMPIGCYKTVPTMRLGGRPPMPPAFPLVIVAAALLLSLAIHFQCLRAPFKWIRSSPARIFFIGAQRLDAIGVCFSFGRCRRLCCIALAIWVAGWTVLLRMRGCRRRRRPSPYFRLYFWVVWAHLLGWKRCLSLYIYTRFIAFSIPRNGITALLIA